MKKNIIVFFVSIIVVLLPIVIYQNHVASVDHQENLTKDSQADWVEATLNVYYAYWGEYPSNIERMKEKLVTIHDEGYHFDEEKFQRLTSKIDLEYEVRGDQQAYKIRYHNTKGDVVERTKEYRKDFH